MPAGADTGRAVGPGPLRRRLGAWRDLGLAREMDMNISKAKAGLQVRIKEALLPEKFYADQIALELVNCVENLIDAKIEAAERVTRVNRSGERNRDDGEVMMSDRKGDPTKQPPECKPVFTPIPNHPQGLGNWSSCPNLQEVRSDYAGETYECDVCGERYWLDYDEMR
jgi:hypothetical protein